MSRIFGRLFAQPPARPDGLSQTQREAIVDLLSFCMCADDKLRPVEDRFINGQPARYSWQGAQPFDIYSEAAIERAGAALKTFSTRAAFLADISERLASPDVKSNAIALCHQLFLVDGEYPESESVVFREIRHVFGRPV